MEYINNILCVSYQELTGGNDPVIKGNTLLLNVYRNNIRRVTRGGGENTTAWYDYNSLPEKYRRRFIQRFGNPEELIKKQRPVPHVVADDKAGEYFANYRYDMNGRDTTLPEAVIGEYRINASVLNYLIKRYEELVVITNRLKNPRPRRELWETVREESEKLREEYGHTLPASLSRLKDKIKDYKRNSYACLISGKFGNANMVKITPELGELIIALRRSREPHYTTAGLFEEVNRRIMEHNRTLMGKDADPAVFWKPVKSARAMLKWLERPDVKPLWYDVVGGEQKSRLKYSRQIKTELPSVRDALWYGDGTKLNLYYRDENGRICTTSVYEVVDAYSEVLLGYFISDAEDYRAQYRAFRMAIQTAGHKPYEIVYDNQGGHKKLDSQDFFDKISIIHRSTMPYNGRSKTIEAVFGRFQKQVLSTHWNYTGGNITTKKEENHVDTDRIYANRDNLPTLEELKGIYADARKTWNEMPHPATGIPRIEMYKNSVNEETPVVTLSDMVDMFWLETQRPSLYTSAGITIEVSGQKHTYEVFDENGLPDQDWMVRHIDERYIVKYDPYDMRSVRLYRKDASGNLRFERVARPYMKVHRAIQEQSEGEQAMIRKVLKKNEQGRVDRAVAARAIACKYGTDAEQQGLNDPSLKGLSKEMREQYEERVERYSTDPDELGRYTKKISNIDWMDLKESDPVKVVSIRPKEKEDDTLTDTYKKCASKL